MAEAQGQAPTATNQSTDLTQDQLAGTKDAAVAGTAEQSGGSDLSKDAAREAIRKHKLKVDGQEVEVDDDELKRGYSLSKAAAKRLQEGTAAKKQAEQFIMMMKDPEKLQEAMLKLGYTRQQIRQMSEKVLAAELEEELLDPKEREFRQAKAKLQQYEELEKKRKEEIQRKRDEEMKAKYPDDYSKKFVEALKAHKLPGTKGTIAEMAKYISRSAKIGFEMTPAEAAQLVKEDIETAQKSLYGDVDAETLIRLLGDQGLQKIRQYEVSKLKNPDNPTPQEQGQRRQKSPGERMTPAEWRRYNRGS